jgi:hypothetical protein
MEDQKYIFKWGGLRNKNRILMFRSFSIYYSNPFPGIFESVCWWRFTISKIKHFHILGFHFVWLRDRKSN